MTWPSIPNQTGGTTRTCISNFLGRENWQKSLYIWWSSLHLNWSRTTEWLRCLLPCSLNRRLLLRLRILDWMDSSLSFRQARKGKMASWPWVEEAVELQSHWLISRLVQPRASYLGKLCPWAWAWSLGTGVERDRGPSDKAQVSVFLFLVERGWTIHKRWNSLVNSTRLENDDMTT